MNRLLEDKELQKEFLRCMKICQNGYKNSKIEPDWDIVDKWELYEVGHVQVYFANRDNDLYIVFPCTNGKSDWFDNFKFWYRSVPYREKGVDKNIKVHTGFYTQYRQVRERILKLVAKEYIKKDFNNIYISGWSLGAALSTLCALDLCYNFKNINKKLYHSSEGSPRVGNKKFKNSFIKYVLNSSRFVNSDDLVCKVPMPIFFYNHTPIKVKLGKRKWYKFISGSTNDHEIKEYIKNYIKLINIEVN